MKIVRRPPEWVNEKKESPEIYWNRSEIVKELNETKYEITEEELSVLMRWVPELLPEKAKVIDFGCGNGRIISSFKNEKQYDVLGVDCSEKFLDTARSRFEHNDNISFLQAKIQNVDFEDEFDLGILANVLQHQDVENKRSVINSVWSSLKVRGLLFMTEKTISMSNYVADGQGETVGTWIEYLVDGGFNLLKYTDGLYLFEKEERSE